MELSSEFSIRTERPDGGNSARDAARCAPAGTDVEAFRQALEGTERPDGGNSARDAARCVPAGTDVEVFRQALEGDPERLRQELSPERREKGVDTLFSAFERASSGRQAPDGPRAGDGLQEKGAEQTEETTGRTGGDPAVVEALFRGRDAAPMVGIQPERTVSATAAPAAAGLDGEVLETLVSRILVNAPESGPSEVRLQLSDNVLHGAEISIARDPSGHLAVALVTKDPAAFQTLVASRGELLASLEKTEAGTVSVEVRRESGGDEGDMRRRSRGLEEVDEDGEGYIR